MFIFCFFLIFFVKLVVVGFDNGNNKYKTYFKKDKNKDKNKFKDKDKIKY